MTRPLLVVLPLLAIAAYSAAGADAGLGMCLRQTFFGQDTWDRRFSPRMRANSRKPRLTIELHQLHARAPADDGLLTVVAAGSGPINLADLTGGGGSNGGAASSTTSTKTTLQVATTTPATTTSTISTSAPKPTATNTAPSGGVVVGNPSQEPSSLVYTCKSDFIDFSQPGAMSKFSFVWCPQNAYQTGNSVTWRLTPECGTTMVYPWDFHYGRIEGRIRIGPGSGVVTSMLLLGPAPSDEIDFEWVGRELSQVQTMYYVQSHRVDLLPFVVTANQPAGSDLSTTFQNYAVELTSDSVKWYLNGGL
ncbi:putative glycosidase CRH2, partial [Coemansia thaxteri]